eukprot:14452308-Alexandrium_andersonii.AAC.1
MQHEGRGRPARRGASSARKAAFSVESMSRASNIQGGPARRAWGRGEARPAQRQAEELPERAA